jgi:hypothetical protein
MALIYPALLIIKMQQQTALNRSLVAWNERRCSRDVEAV